ncbi:MAG: TetR/AcrR family transcriptional regulator [Chloroflexi bacterium]|nr:TetR/AcrR family transcriptional regulator [Chloroflexota bacterium]MDA1002131.1 TetR/AcrR family transcriptional regulator [Chloroflexota bacterium]
MARTSAAVFAAGEALLVEHGVHGITVDDIARRTGIAKTTIYRHWPSKAELVMAIVARQAFQFPSPNTGDAIEDLRICLRALSRSLAEAPRRVALLGVMELAARDEQSVIAHRALLDSRSAILIEVFERGVTTGQLRPDQNVAQTLQLLVSPILMHPLLIGGVVDDDGIDSLIDRVLGPPPA